jgi:orotate phosphoribosyltransferase
MTYLTYDDLVEHDIIKKGDFVLSSGTKSDTYVNIKGTFGLPGLFKSIVSNLCQRIRTIDNYRLLTIIGVPTSGIPFASAIAYELSLPLLVLRSEKKDYGTKKIIEGCDNLEKVGNILLVEDVITTGGSISQCIDRLVELGMRPKHIVVIYQRELNVTFKDKMDKCGISYQCLMSDPSCLADRLNSMDHPICQSFGRLVYEKKSNIILSVDIPQVDKFKDIIDTCAKHVVGIKVHLDIFEDGDRDEVRKFLNQHKKEHKYIVIEDRKFADIHAINLQQMDKLKVIEYADILICHSIAGFTTASEAPLPTLLVAQMSCSNLPDEHSQECIEKMAIKDNIIGVIAQSYLGENRGMYIKPGIRLDKDTDGMNQKYSGKTSGIDLYIVGRGVTESDDYLTEMIKYKEELWV